MFSPHISIALPNDILTEYQSSISYLIEETSQLKLTCNVGHYTSINDVQGDALETYHNSISSSLENTRVYVTKNLVRRGIEFNSSTGTETLYPLEIAYVLEDLANLPVDELVTIHDYVRPEKEDRGLGYTIREGRIQGVNFEVKGISELPSDYYTNISRTRWEGRKWTSINFKFREQRVRNV